MGPVGSQNQALNQTEEEEDEDVFYCEKQENVTWELETEEERHDGGCGWIPANSCKQIQNLSSHSFLRSITNIVYVVYIRKELLFQVLYLVKMLFVKCWKNQPSCMNLPHPLSLSPWWGRASRSDSRHAASHHPLERRSILLMQINGRRNENQVLPHCDTLWREVCVGQPMRRQHWSGAVYEANKAADHHLMPILLTQSAPVWSDSTLIDWRTGQ